MFQSPSEVETALHEMAADVVKAAKEGLVLRNESLPTMLFLTTPRGIATVAILDLAEHLDAIKEAITVTEASGFLFAHDGFIHFSESPERFKAVLVVTVTRGGATVGTAHPYTHTPLEGVLFEDPIPAPPNMLTPYEELLS